MFSLAPVMQLARYNNRWSHSHPPGVCTLQQVSQKMLCANLNCSMLVTQPRLHLGLIMCHCCEYVLINYKLCRERGMRLIRHHICPVVPV